MPSYGDAQHCMSYGHVEGPVVKDYNTYVLFSVQWAPQDFARNF